MSSLNEINMNTTQIKVNASELCCLTCNLFRERFCLMSFFFNLKQVFAKDGLKRIQNYKSTIIYIVIKMLDYFRRIRITFLQK